MKTILTALVVVLASFGMNAQTELTADKAFKSERGEASDGWHPSLKVGANFQYSTNEKVIGQVDGTTMTFGGTMDGGLKYFLGNHEWRQTLNLSEAYSKTPTIDGFVKNSDELKYDSLYLYKFGSMPWLGPYARFQAATSIFFGEDARSKSVIYNDENGNNINTGERMKLTDGFSPITFKESVGFFAKAIEEENMSLEFRLGVGAQQVVAEDENYAIKSYDDSTGTAVLTELHDYSVAGLEGGFLFTGSLDEKTTYKVEFDFLVPFINNDPLERDAFELADHQLVASLNSKLYEWVSWTYELKIKKQPLLLNDYQIQQMLLVNFNYTIM